MCAVAGFCRPGSNQFINEKGFWVEVLDSMNRVLHHRGPDDCGLFLQPDCGLAHRRLSIIDLKGGNQPMSSGFDGVKATIVYNGELYNSDELKNELKQKGVRFKTNSDTEIVLMGHLVFGPDFVKKMNGIFAYAFWNETAHTLFLFRDRFGVKPLFFTRVRDVLVFASEIKGLMQYPNVKARLDCSGLCEIFGIGPARTPGSGVFKNFFEVKPGHFVMFSEKQGLVEKKYWQLHSKQHLDSFETTVEKTRFLIEDSVKRQTVSDVEICTFLSGGVDSSVVTAICAQKFKKLGKRLNTFSFDFEKNNEFFKSNNFQPSQDEVWVKKMVDFLHTNHTFLKCSNEKLIENLFKVVNATDLPCMADVEGSLLYFCGEVAKLNKVALTGECADEIFGGYPWFYNKKMFEAKTFPWSMDLDCRTILLKNSLIRNLPIKEYVDKVYFATISEVEPLENENSTEKRRRELSYLNLKWFMQTLLNRMDRTSMFCGLEARVPFADHNLVEYVFNVPWDMKFCGGVVKGLLRESSKSFLPHEVLYRQKSPYPKTYNPEFERCLKNMILDRMSCSNSPIRNFVSRKKLERFLKTPSNYDKPWFGQLMAGPQMLAYLLQIDYWFEKFRIELV